MSRSRITKSVTTTTMPVVMEVMMLDAQGTIYRWSELEGVCQLSENALGQNDTMYEESFGYWNDDDIIDVATTRTCMYCTSNHMLLLGN